MNLLAASWASFVSFKKLSLRLALTAVFIFSYLILVSPAQAAVGVDDATCSANSKTAGTSLACTVTGEAIEVGNVAVLIFAGDNTATSDGNDQLLTSVTDSKSNTWTVEHCFTNSRTAAAAGATTCIAKSKITTELTTSDTITANFSSITAKAIVVREFTVASGNTLRVAGTTQDDARIVDPQAMTVTGLSSLGEYLYIRSVALERTAPGTWSTTTGFTTTGCSGTSGGLNASNMEACGEFQILSSTSTLTSNPTASADDNASIFMALEEVTYTFGGTVYSNAGFAISPGAKTIKIVIGTSTPSVHSTTTDSSGDWQWVVEDATDITPGTPVLVFVDGEAAFKASTFTILNDNTTSVTGLDLYRNRVVLRDEVTVATTTRLERLSFYDSTDDSDVRYTVSGTSSLTVHSGNELYITEGTMFAPEGAVTIEGNGLSSSTDGSLYIAGAYVPRATTTLAGNLYLTDTATLYPNPQGFVFTATTTGKYIYARHNDTLGPVLFNGVGGGWTFGTAATTSDFTIATGTVTGPIDSLSIYGDMTRTGEFISQGGKLEFKGLARTLTGTDAIGNLVVAEGLAVTSSTITHGDLSVSAIVSYDGVLVDAIFFGTELEGSSGQFGSIYRCLLSSGCDATGDFTEVFTAAEFESINSLALDMVSQRLFVGTGDGDIYRCLLSSGCDAGGDFSVVYPSAEESIKTLVIDEVNQLLFAGTGNSGLIVRCDLATDCNASGDFVTAYDTSETVIESLVIDTTRNLLFAGTNGGGLILRCDLATNCDSSGDFTTAYDTTASVIRSLAVDSLNGVLYVGSGSGGIIYRCDLATNCDSSGDFTTAYDTASTNIYSLEIDTKNDLLYAGGENVFYVCQLNLGCDSSGDFSSRSGIAGNISDIYKNGVTGEVYFGADSLIYYIDTSTSSLTIVDSISLDNLTIGAYASATLPASLTIDGQYNNNGLVYAAATTTFTGFMSTATGTLTGASAFDEFVFSGESPLIGGNPTSTLTYEAVITDPSTGAEESIDMAVDDTAIYVTGYCTGCNSASGTAFYTVAYDKVTGEELWATTTDPGTGDDEAQGITVDSDNVYVTGYCDGCGGLGGDSYYTVVYDKATGDLVWASTTDITAGTDRAVRVVVDADYAYVTGRCGTCGVSSGQAYYTMALNKTNGNLVWATTTDPGTSDIPTGIIVDEKSLYVSGYCTGCGGVGLAAYFTVSYDKYTGMTNWEVSTDPTTGIDIPFDMASDGDNLYVTGYCPTGCGNSGGESYYTVGYAKEDGTELWATSTDPDSGNDRANGIAVDGEYLYLTGYTTNLNQDVQIAKLNKNDGTVVANYETDFNEGLDYGVAIEIQGNYLYVAGACTSCGAQGDLAFYVAKHNKSDLALATGDNTFNFGANASTSDLTIIDGGENATNTMVAPVELSISGDYTNNDTFTAASGTVVFSGSGLQLLSGSLNTNTVNTSAFHNLVLNGGGDKKPIAPLQVTGDFLNATGTEFLASSTLTVGGNFTSSGTYTISTSTALWTEQVSTTSNWWRSVTYGEGLFVAVGCTFGGESCDSNFQVVKTSPDGINWTIRDGALSGVELRSVTYGNGTFVAVACGEYSCNQPSATTTTVMTSPDGVTWTAYEAVEANHWQSVTYGNGTFVAVASNGTSRIMTSPDGVTWTAQSNVGGENVWYDVTYGNGLFIAGGCKDTGEGCQATTTAIMTSSDGISWTARTLPEAEQVSAVTYGNGIYVAMCGQALAYSTCANAFYSYDAITWQQAVLGDSFAVTDVTYGNGLFIATLHQSANFLISTDGLLWDSYSSGSGSWYGIAFADFFVAVGEGDTNDVITSYGPQRPLVFAGSSGTQTIQGTLTGTSILPEVVMRASSTKQVVSVASSTGLIIEDSSGPAVITQDVTLLGNLTNDATLQASGTVYFSGDLSVTGSFSTSSYFRRIEVLDGLTSIASDATTTDVVVHAGARSRLPDTLIVTGDFTQNGTTSNYVWNWELASLPEAREWASVGYGNGRFVALSSNLGAYSDDGVTWSTTSVPANYEFSDIVYGEGLFVTVVRGAPDNTEAIMTSSDGISWTFRAVPAGVSQLYKIAYGGGMFVVVSDSPLNPVITSSDGISWTKQTIGFRYLYDIAYGNGLFVAVGFNGTLLTSTDGVTWTDQESAITGQDLTAVVYGNGLFIVSAGGSTMYSSDGINWTLGTTGGVSEFGAGQFVEFGGGATFDALDWTQELTYPIGAYWTGVTYGENKFVTICQYDYSFQPCDFVAVVDVPTLVLAGTSTQTLSGSYLSSNSLANVTVKNASAPVVFADATNVTGQLSAALPDTEIRFAASELHSLGSTTLTGTSGNEVLLRSTASGTRFSLEIKGDYDITYTDVKDSSGAADGGPIDVTGGTNIDSGNNTGWLFTFDPDDYLHVSGVVYEHDLVTPITGGATVSMMLVATSSGVVYSTQSESTSGEFNFDIYLGEIIATSTPVSVFIDGNASLRAVTVTKTSGTTTLPAVNLYEDRVTVTQETGGLPVTIADMSQYDADDDSDIPFFAYSDILEVERGFDLYVEAGKEFSPEGTVYASSTITIGAAATYTAPTSTTMNGTLTSEGSFVGGDGTLTMNAIYSDILGFLAGRDVTGNNSAGTGNLAVNAIVTHGNYLYIGKAGSATACSQTAGSAIGCEIMVFDVSSSTNPLYVAGVDVSGSDTGTGNLAVQALAVANNYLYVGKAGSATACSQNAGSAIGCEIMVFNISSSTVPLYLRGLDVSGSNNGTGNSAVQTLAVSGGYLYVGKNGSATACSQTAGSAIGCELMVFNASSYDVTYVAGRDASGNDTGTGNVIIRSLSAMGDYLYIGKGNNATACSQTAGSAIGCEIQVYDISSTTNPVYVAGRDVTGDATGTGTEIIYALDADSGYLYVGKAGNTTACSQTAGSAIGCEVQVYDISSTTNPIYVAGRDVTGSVDGVGSAIVYSVARQDNFLYTGKAGDTTACSQTAGSAIGCEIQVYDISSTTNPVYSYGRDASGSAAGTGSANANAFGVTREQLYVAKAGSATACAQTISGTGAVGCELLFFPVNFSDRGRIGGDLVGTSNLGTLNLSGDIRILDTASTTNITIATSSTFTVEDDLSVSSTLTAYGSTTLTLAAGATTTVQTLNLLGSAASPITLNSTASGTQSNFVLTSTAAVSYTTISDSNACGSTGGVIDVSAGNNADGGNTDCWTFETGEVSVGLAESEVFYVGQATTTLGTVTVTDAPTPGITAASDIRLTIAMTTTDFRFDTTDTTPTFGGTASAKVDGTVTYADDGATLVINVTENFSATNTLTISGLSVGDFASVSTTTSQLQLHIDGDSSGSPAAVSSETFRITGLVSVADHDEGQVSNQFSFANKTNEPFFAFNLEPIGETATVTDMVFTLRGIQGVETGEFDNFSLYRDTNADGLIDGGDVLVDDAGIMTQNGQHGAITFSADFLATTSVNYLVTADTTSIDNDDVLSISLPNSGVSTLGATSNYPLVVVSTVESIQHARFRSGGGGAGSDRIGGAPPEGDGDQGGGDDDGGDGVGDEPDGDNITPDADFYRPSGTAEPSEWQSPENAYLSDGNSATTATNTARQTYTNFTFNIPGGNAIQGISVKIDASGSTAAGTIDVALSWDGGNSYTTGKATPTLSGSDVVYSVGGAADLWGRTWTPTELNNTNFRLRVTANTSSNILRLDALEVRVYHQATGGGPGGGGGI